MKRLCHLTFLLAAALVVAPVTAKAIPAAAPECSTVVNATIANVYNFLARSMPGISEAVHELSDTVAVRFDATGRPTFLHVARMVAQLQRLQLEYPEGIPATAISDSVVQPSAQQRAAAETLRGIASTVRVPEQQRKQIEQACAQRSVIVYLPVNEGRLCTMDPAGGRREDAPQCLRPGPRATYVITSDDAGGTWRVAHYYGWREPPRVPSR